MAETQEMAANQNGATEEVKSFSDRLQEIPMYTMSLNQLYSLYSNLRERNEVLKKAFDTGEYYAKTIASTAKPVLMSATTSALAAAKPVIGEVNDPGAALDSMASKTLSEVGKKFPVITKTPTEIAESTREALKNTATSCMEKLQGTAPAQMMNKQVGNMISLSELMVEICFPTDGSKTEDVAELEREETAENESAGTRIKNLKSKLQHRGTRKLMTMKPVQVSVDAVQYAQERIAEMNERIEQGTNYMKEKANEAKTFVVEKKTEAEGYIQEQVTKTNEMLKENANKAWDSIYATTMYIPSKAIKVTGEVFLSTKEIVFAYTKAHSVVELPHAIVEMMDQYYASMKETNPQVTEVADKAVAFVVVPAQVVSEYILSSRPVQWIVPNVIGADEMTVLGDIDQAELEAAMTE